MRKEWQSAILVIIVVLGCLTLLPQAPHAQMGDQVISVQNYLLRNYSSASSSVTVSGWNCGPSTYNGHRYLATCQSPYSSAKQYATSASVAAKAPYSTGTWLPTITFGGGSTGITYTDRGGRYVKLGNYIFVSGYMILSSKGSSTGTAAINLPASSNAELTSYGNTFVFNYVTGTGIAGIIGEVQQNTSYMWLVLPGASAYSVATDASIVNNTQLYFSGSYYTN